VPEAILPARAVRITPAGGTEDAGGP